MRPHPSTVASTWRCGPEARLGWVEMAVGLSEGPSYPRYFSHKQFSTSYIAMSLGKALTNNFSRLAALLVIEMYRASSSDDFEAGLNTR